MLNTKLAELLGLKYPVIQGAMANISNGFMAGQISGLVNEVRPVQEILEAFMKDVHQVYDRFSAP